MCHRLKDAKAPTLSLAQDPRRVVQRRDSAREGIIPHSPSPSLSSPLHVLTTILPT